MLLDKFQVKITSIKHDGFVIHFEYMGKHLFLQSGDTGGGYTAVSRMYEKPDVGQPRLITSVYGMYSKIVNGNFKNKTVKNIMRYELEDLVNFMNSMLESVPHL